MSGEDVFSTVSTLDRHIGEVRRHIDCQRTGRVWRPGPGTIYPTLSWLEENGYIESVVEVREEKARKPYRMTPKGFGALKEYRTVKREGLESLEWMRTVWKDI